MNSKDKLIESENNPNFDAELAEQEELAKQFEAQEKVRKIDEAVKLLQDNGFIVTIG